MPLSLLGPLMMLVLQAPAATQPENRAGLMSFDALEHDLRAADLHILDVRPRADYDRGHVPGATWLDIKAAEKLASQPDGLVKKAAWEAWSAPLGITPDLKRGVVLYGDNRQLDAARAWWLLSYLGVEKVALLDGNYSLWAEQARPTTTEPAKVEPRPLAVRFRSERLATRGEVADLLKAKGPTRLIDARSTEEHVGEKKLSKKAGRVPEACHLEWSHLVDKDGRFLDADAARALIQKAGVDPVAPVVTHCQGGGRASVDAFVFERLGHPTRNYYLGWSDWGNAEETQVETGPVPRKN